MFNTQSITTAILAANIFLAVPLTATPAADDSTAASVAASDDLLATLQKRAIADRQASFGFWGTDPKNYVGWTNHSNRLIPVYTYGTREGGDGIDLKSYTGPASVYRSESAVRALYGLIPERTVQPNADYLDQTNIADIQRAAAEAGRKYIFLVVFDGMDWQTTRAAAIWNSQKVTYDSGRGSGTHMQDYQAGGTSQFGWMVTSPHNTGTLVNADTQQVSNPGGTLRGGYDAAAGGFTPWDSTGSVPYLISKPADGQTPHAYTDSASSATSMTTGIKTFNGAINVGPGGERLTPLAHELQSRGYAVGAVSSVPISHATPAAAYAHNVTRNDYQDLTRDMLGLPSIQHPEDPLPGLDVLIGGGYGVDVDSGRSQGENFVPGNKYLTAADLAAADVDNGGRYVTAVRQPGVRGTKALQLAAETAAKRQLRLLGFYGVGDYNGHLPFATANADYQPVTREKGVRYRKCKAPLGPFRFSVPDPFFGNPCGQPELLPVTMH
jgi:alkaline phosphatase